MIQQPAPAFPIFASFAFGLRTTMQHIRLFAILSVVPFLANMGTMMGLRIAGGANVFWLPILQIPSTFVVALQCALILRFLLLQEFPVIADDTARRARNRSVMESAVVYTIVTYLLTGILAGLLWLRPVIAASPEQAAPYMPLAMAAMVLMFWGSRWFWLHVPLAVDWDVRGLYARLKGWRGSLRILGLFLMCSLVVNFLLRLLRTLVAIGSGTQPGQELGGIAAGFDDAVVSAGTVFLAVLFTAATAHAIKFMLNDKVAKPA